MDLQQELRNLDIKKIAHASWPIRSGAILLVCAALAYAGYHFDTKNQLTELKKNQASEATLRMTFEEKQEKSANLELYKEQLDEMRRTFGNLLRQLPSKTEIPALIVDISQTGLASGLEIELFKPESEQKQDFYAEKPIQLKVRGAFHEFGMFASEIAALPRIVTLHDIILEPGKDNGLMTMSATAKTYRYLDTEDEIQDGEG